MRKISFLISAFIFASILAVSAKQITPDQSRLVVEEIASSSPSLRNDISDLQLIQTVYDESGCLRSETILYYVYTIAENKGFVIVAGDDCFYPVIGYSLEDRYDPDNFPPNLQLWMKDVESGISKAIRENKQPTERTVKAWEAYLNGNSNSLRSSQAVDALIWTRWDQVFPYNKKCVFSGVTMSAGCIATAMAQIISYYKYPDADANINAIPAYTTQTKKIKVPAIPISDMTYNWRIFEFMYGYDATGASIDEVGKLIFHCGASVKMDYIEEGSGAFTKDIAGAFANYFGYDKGARYKQRKYYSDDEWKAILKSELDQGRPMIYAGQKSNGSGHAFICDGYDDKGLFHFNFGWNGVHNLFYSIDGIDFPYYNEIIIGIQKDIGGDLPFEMVIGPNRDQYIYPNILSWTTQVSQNENFSLTASFWNIGYATFEGNIGFVLLDSNYKFVASIASTAQKLIPNALTGLKNLICIIPASVPDGNYIIKAAILPSGSDTWQIINAENGYVGELQMLVKKITTVSTTGVNLDETTKTLSLNAEFQLTATVLPTNATNQNITWSSSNESVATVSNSGLVKAISEGTATITTTTEDGGKTADCKVTVKRSNSNIQHPESDIAVYLQNSNELYINTPFTETISIYSPIGFRVYFSEKPEGEQIINIGGVSKTLWIVKGSSGWTRKIFVK